MLTVTFDELEATLTTAAAPTGAAEAHGSLCGALAADAHFDAEAWAGTALPATDVDADALRTRNLLRTLAAETQAALTSQDMEFEPLLPDDEAPLEQRVVAIAAWCAGFLYGIGSGGLKAGEAAVPEPVGEIIRDFGEISRASIDAEETEESNESSYAEIVEYLRAAAQLAFEELEERRAGAQR
jgi:uncharacterized protein